MLGRYSRRLVKCFATSKPSPLASLFNFRDMQNTTGGDIEKNTRSSEEQMEKIYTETVQNLENLKTENKEFAEVLREVQSSIHTAYEQSYENKNIQRLIDTVPPRELVNFAVENFVGSFTLPRSEKISEMFLSSAEKNSKGKFEEESDTVKFYRIYLDKLRALQKGDKERFEQLNEELVDLSNQKKMPVAIHLVAVEVYKVALNMVQNKQKKSKKEFMLRAYELFTDAALLGNRHSAYYIGEMAESGDIPGGIDFQFAYENYLVAASAENAKAFYKLSRFHKEGYFVQKDEKLEIHYLKRAAELGLAEAQHNLGCLYLEGNQLKYDSLKALAWFTQAAGSGFVHSMYNAAMLYKEGGRDGVIKPNINACLTWLEEIRKTGKLNVDNLITKIVETHGSEILKNDET